MRAAEMVGRGELDEAERVARKALRGLDDDDGESTTRSQMDEMMGGEEARATVVLAAVNLLGQISVEKGDVGSAVAFFERAVRLDPEGTVPESGGGGAEKFLWLAQLSEVGGRDSVGWFEKGVQVLRREIGNAGSDGGGEEMVGARDGMEMSADSATNGAGSSSKGEGQGVQEKRKKLAAALCGIVEVYMTDLSWEDEAERVCERCIAEALLVAPAVPEPLQTLASIRISQGRLDEARKALQDSMALWKAAFFDDDDEEEEVGQTSSGGGGGTTAESKGAAAASLVPDFPTRISLARLLMEVDLAEDAVEVVERLVGEDDHSVEAWYLGGWGLYLLGTAAEDDDEMGGLAEGTDDGHQRNNEQEKKQKMARMSSREWLRQSLKLYDMLDYEDDRLKEHAGELIEELDKLLGEDEEGDQDEGDGWESEGSVEEDEDNDMKDV